MPPTASEPVKGEVPKCMNDILSHPGKFPRGFPCYLYCPPVLKVTDSCSPPRPPPPPTGSAALSPDNIVNCDGKRARRWGGRRGEGEGGEGGLQKEGWT